MPCNPRVTHLTSRGFTVSQNAQEVIASYVTDMLALEGHIQKAFAGQLADMQGGRFSEVVNDLKTISEQHFAALRDLAERREQGGQGLAEVMKRAASSVMGFGAAAIDLVRSEKLPKNLRDDYAAISLATVGYLMLYTTAETLGDAEVSELALSHLRHYAKATMTLFNAVPDAVVAFLANEGFPTTRDVVSRVNETVEELWDSGASSEA